MIHKTDITFTKITDSKLEDDYFNIGMVDLTYRLGPCVKTQLLDWSDHTLVYDFNLN